jgi:hypothetical protein
MKCSIVKVSFIHCFISLYMMWRIGNSVAKLPIETGLTRNAADRLVICRPSNNISKYFLAGNELAGT